MRLILFDQWEKLLARFRREASDVALEQARYGIVRVIPSGGRGTLEDMSVNLVAATGGELALAFPEAVPGKARDFMVRISATGENAISFEGADAFEGEEDALEPPGDGETCTYLFTETEPGVFLAARRPSTRIGGET